jgi:hypothetical protein
MCTKRNDIVDKTCDSASRPGAKRVDVIVLLQHGGAMPGGNAMF